MATTDFSKFRESGELSDITVSVGDSTFKLHKFPLYIKSDFFRALARTNVVEKDKVELEDFPGGPTTFEEVANYCYNIKTEVTKRNVCKLRCAAEFLQMNNPGNLAEATDRFLMDILTSAKLSRDIKTISYLLLQCKDLGAISEQAKIVDKCVLAIVDCFLLSTRFTHSDGCLDDWWTRDQKTKRKLYRIPLPWFVLLFTTARDRGVRPIVLADLLQSYTTYVISSKIVRDANKEDTEVLQKLDQETKAMTKDEKEVDQSEGTSADKKEDVIELKQEVEEKPKETTPREEAEEDGTDEKKDHIKKGEEAETTSAADGNGEEDKEVEEKFQDALVVEELVEEKKDKPAEVVKEQKPQQQEEIPDGEIIQDLEVAVTLDTLIAELPDNILLADCISPRWSLKVLKIAEANECNCTSQLRKLVSRVVHRLSCEELCELSADVLAEIVSESCKEEHGGQRQMACALVDTYLTELAARDKLNIETFNKMVAAIPTDYRFSHDTLFQVIEAMFNSVNMDKNKLKLSEEQKQALVESIDYTRLSETALQRAYETELVPSSQVTKAALALCSKLRVELTEAREMMKSTERELESYKLDKYKMSAAPSRSHHHYTKSSSSASKYFKEADTMASPRTRSYEPMPSSYSVPSSYTSPYLPSLASEAELKMALDSLERGQPVYPHFETASYASSEPFSYKSSSAGYGSYLDDRESLLETDSLTPRNRLGYTGKPDPWPYRY